MEFNGFNTVVLIFRLQHPDMNIIDVFSYYNPKPKTNTLSRTILSIILRHHINTLHHQKQQYANIVLTLKPKR